MYLKFNSELRGLLDVKITRFPRGERRGWCGGERARERRVSHVGNVWLIFRIYKLSEWKCVVTRSRLYDRYRLMFIGPLTPYNVCNATAFSLDIARV